MKNAFILDLDGTLLDSMDAWSKVGTRFLAAQGKTNIPADLWDTIRPMSRLESADYFISRWGIGLSPEEIRAKLNGLMEHAYQHEVDLKEGALEFLEKHSAKKMCIATNTDRHLVEFILKKLGIGQFFQFIITTSEVQSGKHTPRIFLCAAEKLDVSVNEAVVFDDALHGIRSAKEAGFYTVGVYDQDNENEKGQIMEIADDYVYRLSDWEEG